MYDGWGLILGFPNDRRGQASMAFFIALAPSKWRKSFLGLCFTFMTSNSTA